MARGREEEGRKGGEGRRVEGERKGGEESWRERRGGREERTVGEGGGGEGRSSPEGPPVCSPGGEESLREAALTAFGVFAHSLPTRTNLQLPGECTHLHLHLLLFFFSPPGLEMGRWAEKVCHQQKRTKREDMTDRLEGKIDRLRISQPGSLSSFLHSIPPPPPPSLCSTGPGDSMRASVGQISSPARLGSGQSR